MNFLLDVMPVAALVDAFSLIGYTNGTYLNLFSGAIQHLETIPAHDGDVSLIEEDELICH